MAPDAYRGGDAEEQSCERECNQEELEANVWAGSEPIDDNARGLGGLVRRRLNVTKEECEHEEGGWEDEENFDGGDGSFDEHKCFVA